LDADVVRQARELVQAMRVHRQRLEQALEQVQLSMLRVQINAAELVGRSEAIQLSCPAGPPEVVDEAVAARAAIAESYQVERFWKRAGISVATRPDDRPTPD
jgi:hypothetical protein